MIVLDDKDAMRRVFGYAGDRAIVFCVDFTRLAALSDRLGHGKSAVEFFDFLTGVIDTAFAAQTACVAAQSLGVDSLFTNGDSRITSTGTSRNGRGRPRPKKSRSW